MTTLAEHIIVDGVENRPQMLEKSIYDSWASRIRLFIKGKKHGDYDVQATNIILHGLPPDVYALVNHHEVAKAIWDKVKLPMKGTELLYQERECQLYDLFDKFAFIQVESLYEYYWRFSQLINDMHTIGMTMQQVQVNTKFLNALPTEWSKFVTNVKLAKSLYTTTYNQMYAYLSQHERHANAERIMHERYTDPLALVANSPTLYNPSQSQQHSQGKDLIECVNKAMAFLSAVASRFPSSNNQLRMSSNPRNQATIQDGRVTVQQIQGRQTQSFTGTRNRGNAINLRGTNADAFQTEDLDAYDLDYDDLSLAKAVLMANLSSCDSDVLSEVPYSDANPNDMLNQDVKEISYSEQTHIVDSPDNEIHNVTCPRPLFRCEPFWGCYNIRDQLNTEAEAVQIILTRIDNDIYSIVDACPNACEMWKAIEKLKQGESINVQDLKTNLYWEFGKFTSRDGESLESYYSRFYKMMNELVRNQCDVTNHQVNVQFLLQLQPEWQRFVTLVKQSQELKTVSYHKLYDILKQHQNEVNEIRAERLARTANPLALVAQQQPAYHPQNHPNHNTQYSSTRSQQATRNRGKAIVNSSAPIYDQEPATVTEDDEMSKEKEIDKLMALISLSFKKIYKPTNNNLRTSSNTSRANQDNSPRINRGTGYENQRVVNVAGARENVGTLVVQKSGIQCYNCKEYGHVSRECQKPKRAKDATYHKEKMLLCKQEEAGVQLNAEQADWKDDTDDESDDQELEAHYMYMAQIQEVTPDAVENSGPIFDTKPLHKVQNSNDTYNVFAIENEHPEQPESVNDIYLEEQGDTNITIDSLDMCYDREQDEQDDTDEIDQERDLLASLIEKLKCEIDDSKNRNKFLEPQTRP
ncbi:retrovirus-related pol polyprotein from transposon TNT 1-94 [Tanacetum coccineum]